MFKAGVYIKKTRVPTFRTGLWIVVANSLDKASEVFAGLTSRTVDMHGSIAMTYAYDDDGKYRVVIFLCPNSRAGTIAHEALHAVNFVYHWTGVRPSYSNDEAQAYLLDNIVESCHAAIDAFRNKYY